MKRTLSVMVEDRPGALARISTMFARRGFNIDSLAVGPTERPGVSCITLRVDCEQHSLEQIEKQIHKLVNVLRVTELAPGAAVAHRDCDRVRRPRRRSRPRLRRLRGDGHAGGARLLPRAVPAARNPGAHPHGTHRHVTIVDQARLEAAFGDQLTNRTKGRTEWQPSSATAT